MSLKIYVACSLTGASEADIAEVAMLKAELRAAGYVVLDFYGAKGPTIEFPPGAIYDADIVDGVGGCDLLLVIMKGCSDGRGLEIGAALWKYHKPVLVVHLKGERFSSLVRDLLPREDRVKFFACEQHYREVIPELQRYQAAMLREPMSYGP